MTFEERYINERLDHLGIVAGVCEADARAEALHELKEKPAWLGIHSELVAHSQYATYKVKLRNAGNKVAD
jgi:hypothetical protein